MEPCAAIGRRTLAREVRLNKFPLCLQKLTAFHYTTVQMLESAVGAEHVKLINGGPHTRWEGRKSGTYKAVTVMESFISLGLKQGAHIVAASFSRGGE